MDIWRIFNISEGAHRIHNPFTLEMELPKESCAEIAVNVDGGA